MLKHQLSAVGRLAADPEARYTPQGTAVANARVAIEDGYWSTDEGKWISRTIWATLTFWGNAAEGPWPRRRTRATKATSVPRWSTIPKGAGRSAKIAIQLR